MDKRIFLLLVITFSLAAAGCNLPSGSSPPTATQPGLAAIQTAAALTLEAQSGVGASTQPPPAAATPPTTLTETPDPSNTPFPTATATESIPCDRAAFVKDVSIPDGTDFEPGDTFTKTWQLRNSGSCTWTTGYALVFDSGNSMGGPASEPLTSSVAPNQTVDISIDLTAPNDADRYRGNWKLRNADGVIFGIGNSGSPFYVEIDVVATVNFSMVFENVHICGGFVYATVKIVNTGVEFLSSARVEIEDLDDNITLYGPESNNQPFVISPAGCPPGENDADPGLTYYIAASIGVAPISGHKAEFTLMLCTENSLAGTCIEKSIEFDIP